MVVTWAEPTTIQDLLDNKYMTIPFELDSIQINFSGQLNNSVPIQIRKCLDFK